MTVETEVATLTTAVDNLTSAVNVSKATLDAKVVNAQSAETGAIAASGTASGFSTAAAAHKDQAYTYSQSAASAVAYQDLTAIAATKSVTATDVFVYDTSKDSDGGQWRKRTQGTSWYNEALNTSTRGSRKEFPAVAVIVAESNKVTIYDGDDPSMPMWMVFNANGQRIVRAGTDVASIYITNGVFVVGASGYGLSVISFIEDSAYLRTGSLYTWADPTIAHRNINTTFTPVAGAAGIVNSTVNDIAMTVLPNAPIDSATGLPIPTIAVATDGGVSVIKDDGSVVDIVITGAAYKGAGKIAFDEIDSIWATVQQSGSDQSYFQVVTFSIPASDISAAYWSSFSASAVYAYSYSSYFSSRPALSPAAWPYSDTSDIAAGFAVSGNNGLTLLDENLTTPAEGSVAYITSDYNTGYMVGDIKLAALSDTDATNVVGSELVTNGTFDSDVSGWTATGDATLAASGGKAIGTMTSTNGHWSHSAPIYLNAGDTITYSLFWDSASTHYNLYLGLLNSVGANMTQTHFNSSFQGKTASISYTVTSSGPYYPFFQGYYWGGGAGGQTMIVDNVSLRLADQDRSVNGNGLAVHGTITKTPVATGADLVGYSGFSASNYLEQPYNSDLDFGTGDFSIMGWWSTSTTASQIGLFRSDGDASSYGTGALFHIELSGTFKALIAGAGYVNAEVVSYPAASFATGGMRFVVIARASGTLNMYIDGILVSSVASDNTMTNTSARLKVGERDYASRPWQGDIALVRISATAPSAQQIKDIYEAEKPLFQDNAQATLYGTSDAVTALAHDSDTNLLHVGTSSGRSVFQGLQRVSNTTTAVGSAISASNNLVVEE